MVRAVDFSIDFVVTWVDGSDPNWITKMKQYGPVSNDMNGVERFRDFNIFEFWFHNIQLFAPWVHKIFLVTDMQKPDFIDKYEKVELIDHRDYIPEKYLPTFNSNVIENFINRIPGLSEHFVLFNDDMFLTAPVRPEDFFNSSGLPVEVGVMGIVQPSEEFQKISFNNNVILNKFFSKKEMIKKNFIKYFSVKYGIKIFQSLLSLPYWTLTGWHEPHLPEPYLKETWDELQAKYPKVCNVGFHHFRSHEDTNQWLYKNWQLASGTFTPRKVKNFGQFIRIKNDIDWSKIEQNLKRRKYKVTVINDLPMSNKEFEYNRKIIEDIFKKIYGEI